MFSVGGEQLRMTRVVMAALIALSTAACSYGSLERALTAGNTTEDAADSVSGADLTARNPAPISNQLRDGPGIPAAIYSDAGSRAAAAAGEPRPPSAPGEEVSRVGEGYDINFQNADVSAVAKVILGDLLRLTYSVDPRVQGTLSLSSGRPIARQDLMPMFESAVKIVNANVVRESGIYKVVPIGEALGNGEVDSQGRLTPGYGISVLPLRFVSAQTVLRAIDSFAAKPGQARVEPSRNLLLVQGSSAERQSAIDAALALDVDWMKNQAVGVFPVRNASPDTIINELRNVFDAGREGAGQHAVRFQPINRLNAVLAVGQSPRVIEQVRTWVARLDRADYDNTTVRVYKLRYGNAKQIAAILRDVFTGSGAPSAGNQDLSQLTPGTSFTRQSSFGTSNQQGGTSTTSTQTQQINTPTFGGGGAGDPQAGAGRVGEPADSRGGTRGGSGATGVDLAGLSTSTGGNAGPAPLPNVRITADVANNSLLIYASRDQYKLVERAIFELDKAPVQVAIDVTVAEVTLKNDLQYGVQYYFSISGNGDRKGTIAFSAGDALKPVIGGPGAHFLLGTNKNPRIVIDALRSVTDVKVLSAPALVVLDNQPAVLQVGDQVPVISGRAQDVSAPGAPVVQNVERHDTGVILKVIPRVNANGVVNLDVSQEVSAVVPSTAASDLGPTISQRRVQSSVAVASGQTVLLGGLISSNQNNTRDSIPILGDIKGPIGDLFATTSKKNDRTELIVFIRPQIIRDGLDAQLVAEELRSKLQTIARGTTVEKQIDRARPSNTIFRQQQ
jgi:general secretion pathway protein D